MAAWKRAIAGLCMVAFTPNFPYAETWTCNLAPDGDRNSIPTRVETKGEVLFVYNNDYTGKPNAYSVLEDSNVGVIAISHEPARLTFAMLDRHLMKFTLILTAISGTYEERYSGKCTPSPSR